MADTQGIVPQPEAKYGIASLMRCLLPELFGDVAKRTLEIYRPMRDYDDIADVLDLQNTHSFRVGIHIHGKFYSKRRVTCDVLVDKDGRGPQKQKWIYRDHARSALLWRLPQGSFTVD